MNNLTSIHHKLIASFSPQQKEKIHRLRQRIHIGAPVTPTIFASYNTSTTQPHNNQDSAINLSPLHHAFLLTKTLLIDYSDSQDNQTQRAIEPHYLYVAYPVWYVLAWDKLRQDVRIFRCDRIKKATFQDQKFNLKPLQAFESILSENGVFTL